MTKTGVHVEFVPRATLAGKAWDWQIDEHRVVIELDRELFGHLGGEAEAQPVVAVLLAHIVEDEYRRGNDAALHLFSPKWNRLIDGWADDPRGISPRLGRLLMQAVVKRQKPDLRLVDTQTRKAPQ